MEDAPPGCNANGRLRLRRKVAKKLSTFYVELGTSSAMSDLDALRSSMLYEERAKNRERFGYGNDALFGPSLSTSFCLLRV